VKGARDDVVTILCTLGGVLLPVLLLTRSPTVLFIEVVLVLGTALVVLLAAVAALAPEEESRFDAALAARPERSPRPPDLERLERQVLVGAGSREEFDRLLRPVLRRAAALRLRERHGVDLERDPDAARARVTPALADALGLGPEGGGERPPDPRRLAAMAAEIEAL
jgi:hypothetical protein